MKSNNITLLYDENIAYINNLIDQPVNLDEIEENVIDHINRILPPLPVFLIGITFFLLLGLLMLSTGAKIVIAGVLNTIELIRMSLPVLELGQILIGIILVIFGIMMCLRPLYILLNLKLSPASKWVNKIIRKKKVIMGKITAIKVEDDSQIIYFRVLEERAKDFQYKTYSTRYVKVEAKVFVLKQSLFYIIL